MPNENAIGRVVVDAAIRLHKTVGPGLLESVYQMALAHDLAERGLRVARQVAVPFHYGGRTLEEGFRADLIVEGSVIIELKCVEKIHNAHKKQLLTYLRLSGLRLGFLLNFAEPLMKVGIVRIVNGLEEERPQPRREPLRS